MPRYAKKPRYNSYGRPYKSTRGKSTNYIPRGYGGRSMLRRELEKIREDNKEDRVTRVMSSISLPKTTSPKLKDSSQVPTSMLALIPNNNTLLKKVPPSMKMALPTQPYGANQDTVRQAALDLLPQMETSNNLLSWGEIGVGLGAGWAGLGGIKLIAGMAGGAAGAAVGALGRSGVALMARQIGRQGATKVLSPWFNRMKGFVEKSPGGKNWNLKYRGGKLNSTPTRLSDILADKRAAFKYSPKSPKSPYMISLERFGAEARKSAEKTRKYLDRKTRNPNPNYGGKAKKKLDFNKIYDSKRKWTVYKDI